MKKINIKKIDFKKSYEKYYENLEKKYEMNKN